MKPSAVLPLSPLLRAYRVKAPADPQELIRLPGVGSRFAAIRTAQARFFNVPFLEHASGEQLARQLTAFYRQCVAPPLHELVVRNRTSFLRQALLHLLRCREPLLRKAERFLNEAGVYFVAGLGLSFWSALFQALDPEANPGCTPQMLHGLRRLGLISPSERPSYSSVVQAYRQLGAAAAGLSVQHLDHFLTLVAVLQGRDLPSSVPNCLMPTGWQDDEHRNRLIEELQRLWRGTRRRLAEALSRQDGSGLVSALQPFGQVSDSTDRSPAWVRAVAALWQAEDPYNALARLWERDAACRDGAWLGPAVLHLRDPRRFFPWDERCRRGYATLDETAEQASSLLERYRLYNEGVQALRRLQRLHPLEVPTFLARCASQEDDGTASGFTGFCSDTFRFLAELARNNCRDWFEAERERYAFAVRTPLIELCQALVERYVEPVLCRRWGWGLDTAPRMGRALTSICKNDYGRTVPYQTTLWITFCDRDSSGKRCGPQFFVRLDASGLSYGLRLADGTDAASARLRQRLLEHAPTIYETLHATGATHRCRFGSADDLKNGVILNHPEALRRWVQGSSPVAGQTLTPDDPLLRCDDLVGEILLTFDALLPIYRCSREEAPLANLASLARYSEAQFLHDTYLSADWLARARGLLRLKRQMLLCGVPGTGKTHVAQCLARLLTEGDEQAIRLVQFHPSYSYEEFVEGIRARAVEVDGRQQVTYPVEDGVLLDFAAQAASRPDRPHVLLIDEINRGNLARIFGELLYALEYRDRTVILPYSRRPFRLPENLYLLGTLNAADRSVATLDQALRRRFSFLEMPPDAAVLRAWLTAHPSQEGPEFVNVVVSVFERLNRRLEQELGPDGRVGHSYFLMPDLDHERLRLIWQHQLQAVLAELFAGQPQRLADFKLSRFLGPRRPGKRARV